MGAIPFEQRAEFIKDYLRNDGRGGVNILDSDFVDAYAEATGAKLRYVAYGAHKCAMLSRDLQRMKKEKKLIRHREGLWNMAGMGFPRWVFVYDLPKKEQPQ